MAWYSPHRDFLIILGARTKRKMEATPVAPTGLATPAWNFPWPEIWKVGPAGQRPRGRGMLVDTKLRMWDA